MATNISNIVYQSGAASPAVNLASGDTLNLSATGRVIATGAGASPGVLAAGSNIFNISGDVFSFESFGIDATGGGNVFNIASTATVFGLSHGIRVAGAGSVVTNAGDIGSANGHALRFVGSATLTNSGNLISGNTDAILFAGANNKITNTGYIEGAASNDGMQFGYDDNTLVNTGTIRGAQALDFDGEGGVNSLFNTGTLIGTVDHGYDGSGGQDLIINNGLIQGDAAVKLDSGNDVYDGRNGTVVGAIEGDAGDDILFGGVEGETLRGGADNDQIFGGGGADVIFGDAGIDLILGGAGGDVIRGGLGVDLFGFNVGDNGDLIRFFNEGGVRDGFDLRGYFDATGFAGNDPRGAGILQVLQNGADTDVYLHGAFAFRIEGVAAAAIDDSYFLFQ